MAGKTRNEQYLEYIEAILEWADDADRDFDTGFVESTDDAYRDFDTGFVESVKRQLENGVEVTSKQMRAIDRIIAGFHIEI